MQRLLFSQEEDGTNWSKLTAKPHRIRNIVNILAAKLPLGPFHKTVVPFPVAGAARDNGQSTFVQKLVTVVRVCMIDKAESLFGPDPKLASATARVILAYLQYWNSFDSWSAGDATTDFHRQIGLHLFHSLVWRVMHRQRPALLALMTAHGAELIAAMLSESSKLSATDQGELVLGSVHELLRPVVSGDPEPFARALWHGGAAECIVRLILRPADGPDERGRRTSALLCARTIVMKYVYSPEASITDPLLPLLSSAIACVLKDELQSDSKNIGIAAAVVSCIAVVQWIEMTLVCTLRLRGHQHVLSTATGDRTKECSGRAGGAISVRQGPGGVHVGSRHQQRRGDAFHCWRHVIRPSGPQGFFGRRLSSVCPTREAGRRPALATFSRMREPGVSADDDRPQEVLPLRIRLLLQQGVSDSPLAEPQTSLQARAINQATQRWLKLQQKDGAEGRWVPVYVSLNAQCVCVRV
eukprot:TRINITY_DN747_c0_g3_i1.p1 TRINITY_DN747_c0_g3~~TRINITY_DN747_c0_g3_i1.p1  ORF type:complete len:513 (+),score=30.66 TRINITY_DN747_c0_g3_i1:133-1539(+)